MPNDLRVYMQGLSGSNNMRNPRLRLADLWACYSGNLVLPRAGVINYTTWPEACGIVLEQENAQMYKNAGLFFVKEIPQGGFAGNPYNVTATVCAYYHLLRLCGPDQYPGGCSPDYSIKFGAQETLNAFPEMDDGKPKVYGYLHCPYTTIYDNELRDLNLIHIQE